MTAICVPSRCSENQGSPSEIHRVGWLLVALLLARAEVDRLCPELLQSKAVPRTYARRASWRDLRMEEEWYLRALFLEKRCHNTVLYARCSPLIQVQAPAPGRVLRHRPRRSPPHPRRHHPIPPTAPPPPPPAPPSAPSRAAEFPRPPWVPRGRWAPRARPFSRASCELIQCPRRIVRAAHREGAQVNGKMGAAASSDRPWPRTPWGHIQVRWAYPTDYWCGLATRGATTERTDPPPTVLNSNVAIFGAGVRSCTEKRLSLGQPLIPS